MGAFDPSSLDFTDPFSSGGGALDPGFDPTQLIDQTAGISTDPNASSDPTFSTTVFGTDPSQIQDLPLSTIPAATGTCDPSVDPNCSDAGSCDSTDPFCQIQFSPYDPSLDPVTLQWCLDNPNECDTNGPTASGLSLYCTDNPQLCSTGTDGTLQPIKPGGSSGSGAPSGGASGGGAGGSLGGKSGGSSGSGSSANPLQSLLNGLKNLLSTCPTGYVKTSAGTCVRSTGTTATQAGILGGSNSTLWLLVAIAVVILVINKKEGK